MSRVIEPRVNPLLSVHNLAKSYSTSRGDVRIVRDISFSINRGSIVGLVGESGCGKTTVGKCLLRLTEPSGGRAVFDGTDVFGLSHKEMQAYRKRMQIIFQDPYSSLNPSMRITDILKEAISLEKGTARKLYGARVKELLEQVGLPAEYGSRYPNEFSGGQRQRIGIARALAMRPEFIVADEPVAALDVSIQAQILNLILDLQAEFNLTILFISHDLSVVEYLCDEIIVMYLGHIVEMGPTKAIYEDPQHPYTRALLSASPQPSVGERKERIAIKGEIPSPDSPPSGCVFRTRCPHATVECAELIPPLRRVGHQHVAACIHIQAGEGDSC
ncbi:ATP-binding cassette domain-containing protein [Pusillimonas sp. SM2304]|uniref:ABC transporter ATP-binding protein n=1 Tax=Pusillimonas sp. SM2304 TaxID=3073241 RepID=UPI00287562C0|nr:oligopeptide/dipeptide ABC transporter ATP-binding protein [Pusillimonas sp. SM2304]MDS1140117.1 ATP-binding cassette domain-containing protein [Pusillimonas sp. SM2304]